MLLKFRRSAGGKMTKSGASSLQNQFWATVKFILQTVANVIPQFLRGRRSPRPPPPPPPPSALAGRSGSYKVSRRGNEDFHPRCSVSGGAQVSTGPGPLHRHYPSFPLRAEAEHRGPKPAERFWSLRRRLQEGVERQRQIHQPGQRLRKQTLSWAVFWGGLDSGQ